VEQAASILGSPRTWVWLQDPETGDLVPEACWGLSGQERARYSVLRIDVELADVWLSNATEPFMLRPTDFRDVVDPRIWQANLGHAIAPLQLEGRFGFIVAAAPALGDYTFSERKLKLLAGIAYQAKLALANVNNFEILETTFHATIEALANALEAKDEYTSSHTRTIVDMSLEVGEAMGLDAKALKRLEMGALFHDIGKIGIPSDILLKPGPLTDDERRVMNTHPELGERILAPIDRLGEVRPIVRACHEHYDGGGYPDGKVGPDIPIEARIILVCDAYDAMTTDRPYRKRMSPEEACRRIRESRGSQFDPEIADLFLMLIEKDPVTQV
jgi:HD-GYP domain-containing protein (c-di-GMP phosphodiesterase class II)